MAAVVSDTSPLVYLTRLGHFDWLRQLYSEVLIPPAVWNELVQHGAAYPESHETRRAVHTGWIKVQGPQSIPGTLLELDPGEKEAIALAKELNALLIIDEADGRVAAAELGVSVIGTLGLLLEAKARGLMSKVRNELDRLTQQTTFRLGDELRALVLKQAGETEAEQ